MFIVLVLVSSQSVIETVNVGLGAAWINYSGRSPLDSTGTQAVCLSNVMRWVRGTVVGSMGCGCATVHGCGRQHPITVTDGHTVQRCLPSVMSPIRLWHYCTVMIIEKKLIITHSMTDFEENTI